MPIKKEKSKIQDISSKDAAAQKAEETFRNIEAKRFESLPQTTETLSFRVPKGEKLRITNILTRHGYTRSEGLKKATYDFIKFLENQ